jgi:hypothetical protein
LQIKTKKDLQDEVYDQRVLISKLYSHIDSLMSQMKVMQHKNNSGFFLADCEDILNDVHFMYRMGETRVKIMWRDLNYCMMEGVNDNEDIIS